MNTISQKEKAERFRKLHHTDIESGYAENDIQLQQNIKLLIGTGIAGINIEDTDNNKGLNRTIIKPIFINQ